MQPFVGQKAAAQSLMSIFAPLEPGPGMALPDYHSRVSRDRIGVELNPPSEGV